jgi:hypothetical protein
MINDDVEAAIDLDIEAVGLVGDEVHMEGGHNGFLSDG